MPVYVYQCRDCGRVSEVRQSFSDRALTTCEVCGGPLKKQYGSVGVTFSGSGFYHTESGSGATTSNERSSGPSSSSSSSSPNTPAASSAPAAASGSTSGAADTHAS